MLGFSCSWNTLTFLFMKFSSSVRLPRQELGEGPCEEEVTEEARESQLQVEQSERRMINLQSDGMELVTNIQTAADAKESGQRTEEEEATRLRMERLENEAKCSQQKFEEITRGWEMTKQKTTAQELQDALNSQQQQCAQLLEDKAKLIHDLQRELKARDDCYIKDLKKAAEEEDLFIERMESLIKTLKKTYREELDQIENAYEHERRVLLTANREKWEQYMKDRRNLELENLTQRLNKMEEYEEMLEKLRMEDAEEYNITKKKLDTHVQMLRLQVQQKKASDYLNQVVLDYNYRLQTKKEEEITTIKSQQKRKMAKMQDVMKNLKLKCANKEKQSREETQKLCKDYKRTTELYKHKQKKMRHIVAVDAQEFEDVWLMNEAEVRQLVERALHIDRLIYEQQLGLTWERPHTAFMKLSAQEDPEKPAQRSAQEAASQLIHTGTATQASLGMEEGFLIEKKLPKLLSTVEKDEQMSVKLAAVFSVSACWANFSDVSHSNSTDVMCSCRSAREISAPHEPSFLRVAGRDNSEDAAYWESLAEAIPEVKLKLWDALHDALQKHQ
uniref:Dynein regulatory complex protein 1 n=1 Tax=Myripristis murdjan TaxID=586833 RepID=A0A668AWD7_9TELE